MLRDCIKGGGGGAGGFRPIILRYELKGKARTHPDILRVVLEINLYNFHHSICLEKTSNLKKRMSKSDEN